MFSDKGVPSWSRVGSAIIVISLSVVILRTGQIPDHTDQLAWIIAALYGANQLKGLAGAIANAKNPPPPEQ